MTTVSSSSFISLHNYLNLFKSSFYLLLARKADVSLKSGFFAKKCWRLEKDD
jgi:hypothetical protein